MELKEKMQTGLGTPPGGSVEKTVLTARIRSARPLGIPVDPWRASACPLCPLSSGEFCVNGVTCSLSELAAFTPQDSRGIVHVAVS